MSVAAFNTYKGKIERGTSSLAQVDAAERGKLITADEATRLRAYFHDVYDVRGLAVSVGGGRSQVVTWTGPTLAVGPLVEVTRLVGSDERTVQVVPSDGRAVFAPDVGEEEVLVAFDVAVVAVNGYRGATASTSTTVPAVPAPEPAPAPDAAPVADGNTATPASAEAASGDAGAPPSEG